MNYQNHIEQIVDDLYNINRPVVLTRPKPKFGDYSTTIALELSKELKKPPQQIAGELLEKLNSNPSIYDASVAGPGFINFRVKADALANTLNEKWSKNYGAGSDGLDKTVIVEYPSNNMAKPYSIGHLRSGNQGWAVKMLHQKMGWNVITDNHLGDYGTPFGVWVVGFLNFSSEEELDKNGVYELGRIYIETKKALKDEAAAGKSELASQVQNWLLKLENNDEQAVDYSKKFNEISLNHIHEIMNRLKISTDYEFGEAFFAPIGKNIVLKLIETGEAKKNEDGSVIIDISEQGIKTPVLVQKSNGAALYATNDLATIMYREDNFQPNRVVYAVGDEQSFYFKQLFAVAKKLNVNTELIHLSFGLIDQINADGVREKMSSRKGVVLMEELLNTAEKKAKEVVQQRNDINSEVSQEDIKKISLGAIKFSDFTADRRTNILFDWDTIFSLSGFSGPSVQYAAVRINKIINSENLQNNFEAKITEKELLKTDYNYEAEKGVLLKLLEYPVILRQAYNNLEPHKIATYLYELAREMNRYYETTRIKESPDSVKAHRINMLKKVSYVFADGLNLLGIEVPERM